MFSLKNKIQAQAEAIGAVAELAEEKVKPKAKVLKNLKVAGKITGKIKSKKK